MATNKTITVNGRVYDAITGLPQKKPLPRPVAAPVKPEAPAAAASNRPVRPAQTQRFANDIHAQPQRSKTLRRTATQKPVAKPQHPTRGRSMDIAKSARISKFAPHPVTSIRTNPQTVTAPIKTETPHKAPQMHPVAKRALQRQTPVAAPAKPAPLSSKEVKEKAIAEALATPKVVKKKRAFTPWKKRTVIITLFLLALGGTAYGVYRFVPPVSVSIASAQAGVNAKYPDFVPDGFALHHPVTFSEGEVVLTFASNSNEDTYTIAQTKSSWDSTAVLDNVVKKAVGDNYVATKDRGLTIYTYDKNASWVNGGVLYTITSNAHLSNEQIRRIATSL